MRRGAGLLLLLLPLAVAPPAAASPALVGAVGGTAAITGGFDQGGASIAVAVLWPVEGLPLRFGVMGHGDDLGTRLAAIRDRHDGSPRGTVATGHRAVWGASWRLDAGLPVRAGLEPGVSASWGYYWVADDAQGGDVAAASSAGFSLAVDLARQLGPSHAAGIVVRYHRLFNDLAGRYITGAVEWRWGGPAAR